MKEKPHLIVKLFVVLVGAVIVLSVFGHIKTIATDQEGISNSLAYQILTQIQES